MHRLATPQFSKTEKVVGIFYLSLLKHVLDEAGYSLRGFQGTHEDLHDPHQRISLQTLFRVSLRSLGDLPGGLGFKYGHKLNLVAADTVGQVLMSSANLQEALCYLQRYHPLLSVCLNITPFTQGDKINLHFEHLYPPGIHEVLRWFVSEALLTSVVRQAEWLTGKQLPLVRIGLPYAAPKHAHLYRSEFACEVDFDAPTHQLVFDAHYLDYPILTANAELCALKARHCDAALRRRHQHFTFATRVKTRLAETYPVFPTIEEMAEQFHTSRSCLYRRLQEEHTSYQQLVNEIKREASLSLLRETMMTVGEISEKLGFSDASSFRRAFKNWTGMQPSSVRQLKQV